MAEVEGTPMPEWNVDLSEVDGLRHWYGQQPKKIARGSAMMLNRFAWGTRDEAVKTIGALMTVRNPRFVSSKLRVTKALLLAPIEQQQSSAGSVAGARFSGWVEQEKGTRTARKRISTLASRAGDYQRQMIPKSRLKPANTVESIESLMGSKMPRGGSKNYAGLLAILARQGYKGLVRIKGGIYLVDKGGRRISGPTRTGRGKLTSIPSLQLVQEMKKKQPKEKHWMRQARAIYFKKNPPQQTWNRIAQTLITPPSKK